MSWNNQVVLVGSLGADPEIRYSQNGAAVVNFRVATSEKWTDKASGSQKEETEWHSCVWFGEQAANAAQNHLRKGSYVRVEGRLKTESYEKDGQKKFSTKIYVQHVAPGSFPKPAQQPYVANNPIPFAPPGAPSAAPAPEFDPMAEYGDINF